MERWLVWHCQGVRHGWCGMVGVAWVVVSLLAGRFVGVVVCFAVSVFAVAVTGHRTDTVGMPVFAVTGHRVRRRAGT